MVLLPYQHRACFHQPNTLRRQKQMGFLFTQKPYDCKGHSNLLLWFFLHTDKIPMMHDGTNPLT